MADGNEIPRRSDIYRLTLPERAIDKAMLAVELAGTDDRLTEAARLLGVTKDLVADFVDGVPRPPVFGAVIDGPNPLGGVPHTITAEGDDLVVRLPLQGFGGVPVLSDVLALLFARANEVAAAQVYLDKAIGQWRTKLVEARGADQIDMPRADMAACYIDAFQSVRASLLGATLPADEATKSAHAAWMARRTDVAVAGP